MSEKMPAWIQIGGRHPWSDDSKLCREVEKSGAGPDWDVPFEDPVRQDIVAAITVAVDSKEPLSLYDSLAIWGQFGSLEEWCRENDMTYRRHTLVSAVYNAELSYWKPGMSEAVCVLCNAEGEVVVPLSKLKKIVETVDIVDDLLDVLIAESTIPEVPSLSL